MRVITKPLLFRKAAATLLMVMISLFKSYGQTGISYKDVAKIIISEKCGGMSGSCTSVNEITKQDSKWAVFHTEETRAFDAFLSRRHPNFSRKGIHVFQKYLDEQTVINFIAAAQLRPIRYKAAVTGITADYLKANADKVWLSFSGLPASQKKEFLNSIRQPRVDSALNICFSNTPTDVYVDCVISIIKKNTKDTVSFEASYEYPFLLPWVINKRDTTYNMQISQFAVAVLGQDSACNLKPLLAGERVYSDIYDFIFRNYCEKAFTQQDYELQYPQAFALLRNTYHIIDVRSGSDFAFLKLQPKTLPANIYLNDALHVGNADSVAHAIHLKDVLAAILKHSNFVFKYAAEHPSSGYLTFIAPGDSTTLFPNQQGDFPYLQRFNASRVITFYYNSKTNDRDYSLWYLLPNGQLVLSYYEGDSVLDIPKQKLNDYSYHWRFDLFDEQGNLININSNGEVK